MSTSAIIDCLRESSLFSKLSDEELSHLAQLTKQREFGEGRQILAQGAKGASGMWIILEGKVEIRTEGRVLAQLGPGDHFGEMALVSGRDTPRSADAVAVAPTRAAQLTRWDLRGLISSKPDIALSMLTAMADRLRSANAELR